MKRNKATSGRPKKIPRTRLNAGRKPALITEASKSTIRRRAIELLNDERYNNLKVLETALKILKQRLQNYILYDIEAIHVDESGSQVAENQNFGMIERHSKESALALVLELRMSKHPYEELLRDLNNRGCSIFVSWNTLGKAKEECRPKDYMISEVEVSVPLQQMLEKTAERLCEAVALDWPKDALKNILLSVTTGFDGASGYVNPQQKFDNEENDYRSPHQSLFVCGALIIQLKSLSNDRYCWNNPTPQSYRFFRPLRIANEKEDDEVSCREYNRLNAEINRLKIFKFTMSNGKKVCVQFSVAKTLFDGKNVNAIMGNKATQRCPVCLVTTHNFNQNNSDFTPVEGSLLNGLGLLHCEIKTFDHLLHIAYKNEVKIWNVNKNIKDSVDLHTTHIRNQMYDAFKIRPDQVIQGKGTSNTGNLARKCFEEPEKFAIALEIDKNLICNLVTILKAYRCGLKLQLDELQKFSDATYELHYEKYPWARMNPSLHKLLKHGTAIVRQFPMPIAYYAEDALESMHKIHRETVREHSRRNSRENAILDTYNRGVYLSDPLLSMVYLDRRMAMHKRRGIPSEIKRFLQPGEWSEAEDSDSTEEETEQYERY